MRGAAVTAQSRNPRALDKRHNHPSSNRKANPSYRDYRIRLRPRPGGFGEVLDAVGEDSQPASQAELSRQMHEWAINAEQALCSARACGREPGGIERPLAQARQSEHDWRAILRDFITAMNPSDYRWAPPNRRFVSSGLYLPSVERSGVGEMVIVVDTSGSIGTDELEQFAGEINSIVNEAQPESIRVIYCDAFVQAGETGRSRG